jgi:exodeoxyribonuclease VII small subunit
MSSKSQTGSATSAELNAFEKDLERLEEIVSLLEKGGATLQESLLLFEEGMALGKKLQRVLERVELRIEELIENENGSLETRLHEPSA